MKKKTNKKKKPTKQKIDIVIESLVHLEQKVKELIQKVEQLEFATYHKNDNKYWPNTNPPFKYDGIMWNKNAN